MTDLSAIAALESRVSVLMARNADLERKYARLEREHEATLEQLDALRNSPTQPAPPLDCDCDLPSTPTRDR